jgi:ankyrin repeat protein
MKRGDWPAVEAALTTFRGRKLDLKQHDHDGFTPLLLAIKESKLPSVEKMLAMGADLNATANDKMTAMHVAAKWGSEEMVKFLLEKKLSLGKKTEVRGN